MGKGYNNFMCKKFFHPGSRDNIKRVWMAEQRKEKDKEREESLRQQYEKEQDLYNNRLLVSTESRDKLSLNFMYEAPAGASKERVREDGEPEFKFEWQRNAPRESFAKDNTEIRDQPFGIQVKNVRCLKCHVWGHMNTDSECPLNQPGSTTAILTSKANSDSSAAASKKLEGDRGQLIQQMREEGGLTLKKSLASRAFDDEKLDDELKSLTASTAGVDPEIVFLNSLSKKDKKKLLKRLNILTGSSSSSSSKLKKKRNKEKQEGKEKDSKSRKRDGDEKKMKRMRGSPSPLSRSSSSSGRDQSRSRHHRERVKLEDKEETKHSTSRHHRRSHSPEVVKKKKSKTEDEVKYRGREKSDKRDGHREGRSKKSSYKHHGRDRSRSHSPDRRRSSRK